MAAPAGTQSTYDLLVGTKLEVEDLIHLVSPYDVPLVGYGMTVDNRTALGRTTVRQKKVEWLDEELLTPKSTIADVGGIDAVATEINVPAGEGLRFEVDDVLRVEDELVIVTAITDDELTITRGFAGTTGAVHAEDEVVVGVGKAAPEGSNPQDARAVDRNNRFNFTQIFGPVAIQTSGSEDVVDKYGVRGTEHDHQVANRTKEQFIACEQAVLYGVRLEDTANKRRLMGGISFFVTTNVDTATTTDITDAALLALHQATFDAGGNPDRLVLGSQQKAAVSDFSNTDIRYRREEQTRGHVVEWFESDFGLVSIILNRWVRSTDAFLFARDNVDLATLRPMVYESLAKTGDSTKGQVVGEKTLRFRKESHAGRFAALGTA